MDSRNDRHTSLGDVTHILAIRHGETSWNVDTRIQGQIDIPLNDQGRWQARRLAAALCREDHLDAVYASDLSRAVETARAVADRCELSLQLDAGLRERNFGVFQGRTTVEIERDFPDQVSRWRGRDPSFGPEQAETLQAFYDRCVGTFRRLALAHPGQTIAVVAHGGVLDSLYRAATRHPLEAPRTWKIGNASVSRLLHSDGRLNLLHWGDTSHLDAVGEVLDEDGDGGRQERPPQD